MRFCLYTVPAADDGLAGQREVKEGLTHFEREGVFERLSIYDES